MTGHVGVLVRVFRQVRGEREGETGAAKKGKKNLLPLPFERHGRRRYTVSFKTTPFWIFFPVNSE
jgi:hypothetical protein